MVEISGYAVGELLRASAQHAAYRAVRTVDERSVVLKVPVEAYPTPRALARLRHEFEITHDLDIPGIVRALSIENHSHGQVLVLEDIGGVALSEQIGPRVLPLGRALEIGVRLAEALKGVHAHGIIHKDVKPSNIIVNTDGDVALTDFGVAVRLVRHTAPSVAPGMLEGTLAYMAPEQTGRMNRPVDRRSDLYSLGVTMYELLVGALPFKGLDPLDLVHQHVSRMPVAPRSLRPEVPEVLSDLVMRLLEKNAEDRYQTAFGLHHDLVCCQVALQDGEIPSFPLGERDATDAFQISRQLYGREEELALLEAAMERVASGQVELLRVRGPSGIGKSALIGELSRLASAASAIQVSGKFDQYKRDLPYSAILQAFTQIAARLLTTSEDRLREWKDALEEALAPNASVLSDLVPELAHVFGPQPEVMALGLAESQIRFNLVIRRFIRVLTSRKPLVLFLDDVQWADGASLGVLETLLTDPEVSHLLVVVACRDNELDPTQSFDAQTSDITVGPLEQPAITALLAKTLDADPQAVQPLAELVSAKTGGNPFFVHEFLRSLHAARLIGFEPRQRKWVWDLARIQREKTTSNVVDLVVGRLNGLEDQTRYAVQVAAVIGHQFALATLAKVIERPPSEMAAVLTGALAADILEPLGDDYKYSELQNNSQSIRYAFHHDRVHQAAYSTLAEHARPEIHHRVGRMMLDDGHSDLEESMFDVVNHMNAAAPVLTRAEDQLEVALLNLRAANKAIASMAYGASHRYSSTGREMLGEQGWAAHAELTWDLHFVALQAAFLRGEYDAIRPLARELVERASDPRDAALATEIEVQYLVSTMQYGAALDVAIPLLDDLGVPLPRHGHKAQVVLALLKTKWALRGRDVAGLVDLPNGTDPAHKVAMRVMVTVSAAAYAVEPDVFPQIVFKLVQMSLKHGNTPQSAFGYVCYGLAMCSVLGDYDGGQRFGQLALAMVDRHAARDLEAKVQFLNALFIDVWSEPLSHTLAPFRRGAIQGLETGDLEYYSYNFFGLAAHELLRGAGLDELAISAADHHRAIIGVAQEKVSLVMVPVRETIGFLRDEPTLREHGLDEPRVLELCTERGDKTSMGYCYTFRCMRHGLVGEHAAVLRSAELARVNQEGLDGQIMVPLYQFYESLSALALTRSGQKSRGVRSNQRRLKPFADRVPETFLAKWLLIEAERARTSGNTDAALRGYERAMEQAQASGNAHDHALAHQLAGEWLVETGMQRSGRAHLFEAAYLWERWGATRLARLLRTRYGIGRRLLQADVLHDTTASSGGDDLDTQAITRAARTVAEKLRLSDIVTELLALAMSNAGATRAVLLLGTATKGYSVVARGEVHGGVHLLPSPQPLTEATDLAHSVVRYALRTRRPVVIDDAAVDPIYRDDPYLTEGAARGVLCVPMAHHGEGIGVLYLENHLVAGAFTPHRVEFLGVIAAQAAISIENAELYRDLERSLEAQVALTTAHARFVPHPFLANLGRDDIRDVALGDHTSKVLSVLFSDIRGFTPLIKELGPEQSIRFINSYLSHMEPPILDNGGFVDSYIGDAVMALFDGDPRGSIRAGIDMLLALRSFNTTRAREGLVPVAIGIGINTGPLMLGTIGGPNRMKCGVIGDSVNLAARIESLTKQLDVPLMVGGDTIERLAAPEEFKLRMMEKVTVVGREDTVLLYEVFDADLPAIRDAKQSVIVRFRLGQDLYYRRDWAGARAEFEACVYACAQDRVAHTFLERSTHLMANDPGPAWDGIVRMKKK